MITTHKQDATVDNGRLVNKRSIRLTVYCGLLLAYCFFSFWYYSTIHLFSYDKWQLAALIFIALGSFSAIIFQVVKYENSLIQNMSGAALILGGIIYFIGICLQIKDQCYCNSCDNEFECGCGIFGNGIIITGTSIVMGIDVLYNFLSQHRTRIIIFSSILIIGSIFILINRFHFHLSSTQKVEETGWIFICVACIFSIILVGIIGTITYNIYNGIITFLLFVGGILALIGGIGGYTSSHDSTSYNATIWIFYILVFMEAIVLAIDVWTSNVREYQPLK